MHASDEIGVNKSQSASINTKGVGLNDIEGEKLEDDYDFN